MASVVGQEADAEEGASLWSSGKAGTRPPRRPTRWESTESSCPVLGQ